MSDTIIASGHGHLPKKAIEIAKAHDSTLINYTDPQCKCGYGCRPSKCRQSKRHWFTTRNHGYPFAAAAERGILADLRAAELIDDSSD